MNEPEFGSGSIPSSSTVPRSKFQVHENRSGNRGVVFPRGAASEMMDWDHLPDEPDPVQADRPAANRSRSGAPRYLGPPGRNNGAPEGPNPGAGRPDSSVEDDLPVVDRGLGQLSLTTRDARGGGPRPVPSHRVVGGRAVGYGREDQEPRDRPTQDLNERRRYGGLQGVPGDGGGGHRQYWDEDRGRYLNGRPPQRGDSADAFGGGHDRNYERGHDRDNGRNYDRGHERGYDGGNDRGHQDLHRVHHAVTTAGGDNCRGPSSASYSRLRDAFERDLAPVLGVVTRREGTDHGPRYGFAPDRSGGGGGDDGYGGNGFVDRSGGDGYGGIVDLSGGGSNPPYRPVEESVEDLISKTQPYCTDDAFDKMCASADCQVYPKDLAPEPLGADSFVGAPLHRTLLANLERSGYRKPTPVQRHTIPIMLEGRDVLVSTPTGTGKTGAYALPVLDRILRSDRRPGRDPLAATPRALVIAPTRELAIQVNNEFRKLANRTGVVSLAFYGGTSFKDSVRTIEDRGGVDVVVGTAGRLLHMISEGFVSLEAVEVLVLDEVDRLLQDSHDRPGTIEAIIEHEQLAGPPAGAAQARGGGRYRQTVMVSATFPPMIQRLLEDRCYVARDRMFVQDNTIAAQIEMHFVEVVATEKRHKIISFLKENASNEEKILVFVNRKKDADAVSTLLCLKNFKAVSIHGDRFQEQREEVLRKFRGGEAQILVGTDCASRGLDIPLIAHVLNYDFPKCVEDYIHRVGRTGRLGNSGSATSFYDSYSDARQARAIKEYLQQAKKTVPSFIEIDARRCPFSSYGPRRFRGYLPSKRTDFSGGTRQIGAGPDRPTMSDETWSQA